MSFEDIRLKIARQAVEEAIERGELIRLPGDLFIGREHFDALVDQTLSEIEEGTNG